MNNEKRIMNNGIMNIGAVTGDGIESGKKRE